ncbi:PP2C family protein-serine/threonine phosphatase [Mongoliibacter ruber]|nr:protein phosphatase 2C domain-containing protein [Mongoliibacter ruber]
MMQNYIQTQISDIGGRQENQDFASFRGTKFGFLSVVCDGMGGAKGGSYASQLASQIVIDDITNSASDDPRNALQNAVQKANFEVFRVSINDSKYKGMGTTITVLLLTQEKAYICHVGDSRVYQFRKGQKIYRTYDHSVVFRMLKEGILKTEEQARNHSRSNELSRVLGIQPFVDIEIAEVTYQKDDIFLLCTDGICGELTDEQIENIVRQNTIVDNLANTLIKTVNQTCFAKGGGHDNLTVSLVQAKTNSNIITSQAKNSNSLIYISLMIVFFIIFVGALLSNEYLRVRPLQMQNETFKKTLDSLGVKPTEKETKPPITPLDSLQKIIKIKSDSLQQVTTDLKDVIKLVKEKKWAEYNKKLQEIQPTKPKASASEATEGQKN